MTTKSPPAPPKVFISYSWSGEEHVQWVADLGERLMNDGVHVVLDQWDLKDGQDLNDFMEQMVKDPDIKRVIVVSDSVYADKADNRRGGVGTETQIISVEVYESVDQTKFVPVLKERAENNEPCLPIYLKGRKYIDFSEPDNDADSYDQLLRNIFERPRRRRPILGQPPSHLFEDDALILTSAQRAKRFREFVSNGRGNVTAAFDDFAEEFLMNLEELRMTYTREEADTWCERIRVNIEQAAALRDVFVDVVLYGAKYLEAEQFVPQFIGLLERLLPFQEQPNEAGSHFECSEDNYKLLCYEFFLYTIAAFIKAKHYENARQLIEHQYVAPKTLGGADLDLQSFTSFNEFAQSLEETCAHQGDQRRLSVMADLVHDRATHREIKFSEVMQADIVLWLASGGYGWYPRTMIYSGYGKKCELFLRALSEKGFEPLKTLLNVESPLKLLELLDSEEIQRLFHSEAFWRADVRHGCLNLEHLRQQWGKKA